MADRIYQSDHPYHSEALMPFVVLRTTCPIQPWCFCGLCFTSHFCLAIKSTINQLIFEMSKHTWPFRLFPLVKQSILFSNQTNVFANANAAYTNSLFIYNTTVHNDTTSTVVLLMLLNKNCPFVLNYSYFKYKHLGKVK